MNRRIIPFVILFLLGLLLVYVGSRFWKGYNPDPVVHDQEKTQTEADIEYLASVILEMKDKLDRVEYITEVQEKTRLANLPTQPPKPAVTVYREIEVPPKPTIKGSAEAVMNGNLDEYLDQFDEVKDGQK